HGLGHCRQRADGDRRCVPDHARVQLVLLRDDQRPWLDLHRAGRVRLLAAGQGAAWRDPLCSLRRLPGAAATADRRRGALPAVPDDAVRAVDPRAGRHGPPRDISEGAYDSIPERRKMSFDLIVKNGVLPDGRTADIAISGDKIAAIEPKIEAQAGRVIDAEGSLVSPPFVDPHFHMDATLSYGIPRINRSGTLLEGIALWGELKPLLTHEAVKQRALDYCDWAVSMGLLAIRTHVDTCDDRLLALEALLE